MTNIEGLREGVPAKASYDKSVSPIEPGDDAKVNTMWEMGGTYISFLLLHNKSPKTSNDTRVLGDSSVAQKSSRHRWTLCLGSHKSRYQQAELLRGGPPGRTHF